MSQHKERWYPDIAHIMKAALNAWTLVLWAHPGNREPAGPVLDLPLLPEAPVFRGKLYRASSLLQCKLDWEPGRYWKQTVSTDASSEFLKPASWSGLVTLEHGSPVLQPHGNCPWWFCHPHHKLSVYFWSEIFKWICVSEIFFRLLIITLACEGVPGSPDHCWQSYLCMWESLKKNGMVLGFWL